MNNIETLTKEQRMLLLHLAQIIMNSKYKDPSNPPTVKELTLTYRKNMKDLYKGDYDPDSNEAQCLIYWNLYISSVALHGAPSEKKNGKRDNTKDRRKDLKHIEKLSGSQPNAEYLKTTFQLPPEYDEMCKILDEDIKSLI